MTSLSADVLTLGSALGIGLLVGLERERKKLRDSTPHSIAGLRTFALTSLLGWGAFSLGGVTLLAAVAVGLGLLLAVAYYQSSARDPGLTTEVALLLVLLLGAYCHRNAALAVGLAVVMAVLLAWREGLHRFVRSQLTETEVRDGLVLATAALVVMPLVPDSFMGPYDAFNPHTVWMLCVLMMSIGALGHLAIRLAGSRFGLPLAGFITGFVSGTATVASMGDQARREPQHLRPAVAAATMTTATTLLLMALVLAAVDARILPGLLLSLAAGFLAALAWAGWFAFGGQRVHAEPDPDAHIFDWRIALGGAGIIAAVQVASAFLFHWLGDSGVLLSTAFGAFADVHAAAAAAATLVAAGKIAPDNVVLPVLVAIMANNLSKTVMAFAMGGYAYGLRVVGGLLAISVAMWLPWLLGLAIA